MELLYEFRDFQLFKGSASEYFAVNGAEKSPVLLQGIGPGYPSLHDALKSLDKAGRLKIDRTRDILVISEEKPQETQAVAPQASPAFNRSLLVALRELQPGRIKVEITGIKRTFHEGGDVSEEGGGWKISSKPEDTAREEIKTEHAVAMVELQAKSDIELAKVNEDKIKTLADILNKGQKARALADSKIEEMRQQVEKEIEEMIECYEHEIYVMKLKFQEEQKSRDIDMQMEIDQVEKDFEEMIIKKDAELKLLLNELHSREVRVQCESKAEIERLQDESSRRQAAADAELSRHLEEKKINLEKEIQRMRNDTEVQITRIRCDHERSMAERESQFRIEQAKKEEELEYRIRKKKKRCTIM